MKPRLRFVFDYGCNPLWSTDDITNEKFGYHIDDLSKLGLSNKTIKLAEHCSDMFYNYLNPVYQGFPSFWSGRMYAFFQFSIKRLFDQIGNEIGMEYEIQNEELDRFNEIIDSNKIDSDLSSFVSNPVDFALKKGVNFRSEEELKREIRNTYKEWEEKEYKYYST